VHFFLYWFRIQCCLPVSFDFYVRETPSLDGLSHTLRLLGRLFFPCRLLYDMNPDCPFVARLNFILGRAPDTPFFATMLPYRFLRWEVLNSLLVGVFGFSIPNSLRMDP